MIATNFSFGIERNETRLKENNSDQVKWTNPLEVQLPHAPSMKMYCVYGHGKVGGHILTNAFAKPAQETEVYAFAMRLAG